jgi:uncharacterized protein DUF3800
MYFLYIDESGTGDEPIGVMTGIIVNAYRMAPTKTDWNNLLQQLSKIIGRTISEIHTRDFYPGNSPWRGLDGDQRKAIIDAIFQWLIDRKHRIVYTAVDKANFFKNFPSEKQYDDVNTLWRFMALHLALSIQKCFQGPPRGNNRNIYAKGYCLLIFDNEEREQKKFTDIILNAPDWTDSYYDKKLRQEKFSQITDVPHFVDSKDVGLIQVADFVCFFLRKYLELSMGYTDQNYDNEFELVSRWAELIFKASIPKPNMFLSKGRCECSDLFCRYAPDIIIK